MDTQHGKKCPAKFKYLVSGAGQKAGLVGLENLGNTCYMNSGLQCLSNIKELTCYFLSCDFIKDLNHETHLGMKGKLAE